ncbi:glutamate-5-semialdehyde dehydrogenase [Candidatus Endowatersipora endosymbiont of Watersipora subatra]|uniref:glutamate-5-semialdehyde dehydrogenase n=1 Tax=Candidatus Endowatersipora endosymbiont of Watersipora subatra TaxID=3077946 RepID=UPI00312CBFE0
MLNKTEATRTEISALLKRIGIKARQASRTLASTTADQKHAALVGAAKVIQNSVFKILNANDLDIKKGRSKGLSNPMLDRLNLTESRILDMADAVATIADLPDPVGRIMSQWERPNGLNISKISTPLGVIGVIYESRPNVTAEAGALCLKAGNSAILRSGSDSLNSSQMIHDCMITGLAEAGLPQDILQFVPTASRLAVGELLTGLEGTVDLIIPRGGLSLVQRVELDARVPVFSHLEGRCHVYVDASADLQMAIRIVVNSKLRRPGICNAAETLLIDGNDVDRLARPLINALIEKGCEIRGDKSIASLSEVIMVADEKDWATEYLDRIISARLVDGVDGAIAHIERWSSNHTDAIIAENTDIVSQFLRQVDSAIVLHNASTQFADGGEFGMGAEIGIATGKMHARGPVGAEQLTSFKYVVRGSGQIRS